MARRSTTRDAREPLVARLESWRAETQALRISPDLASIVWESAVAPSSTSALSGRPPSPFELYPWRCFVPRFLTSSAAQDLHARVLGARVDKEACFTLLCVALHGGAGTEALWDVRDTLRHFLVYPEATRRLMRELEPVLRWYGWSKVMRRYRW